MIVSIIIPTVNSPTLQRCLESISKYTQGDTEVVVVCDQPTSERLYLIESYRARPIINTERVGAMKAMNQGLKAACGDYLVLMNDDVFVTSGWLESLLLGLKRHPEFGYVSPIVQRESRDREFYFAGFAEASMMTREALRRVGFLDESPIFAHICGDGDYYARIVKAGYKPHGVIESIVEHLVGQTIKGELTNEECQQAMETLVIRHGEIVLRNQSRLPAYSVALSKVVSAGDVDIEPSWRARWSPFILKKVN